MLKQTFTALVGRYTKDYRLIETLWAEVERCYTEANRHYHTLNHLSNMLSQLVEVKHNISSWDALLFALYYHDIVYNPTAGDNEERSADVAVQRLGKLALSESEQVKCCNLILATKHHAHAEDDDTSYFLDADLSILGAANSSYADYVAQVREEYAMYPLDEYNAGRIKVIRHFLEMPRIFKTPHFCSKLEKQARVNLTNELVHLQDKR